MLMPRGLPQAYTAFLRSPAEHEPTPAVATLMQSYFLKMLAHYRDFMEPEAEGSGAPNSHHHHHRLASSGSGQPQLAQRSMGTTEDDAGYLR